ncbi:MAG: oxygen-independent coproporphyrinogen III oxidase [Acidobacteriota bacterium]|nr:MAG: oxygen-independent coproporphyrinogen III oxidase [Acidobacteriota bacterium]
MSGNAQRPADRETIRRLVAKYDRPGPRYTSYPTAVELSEEVGRDVYEQKLGEANALGDAPLSLYVHLPFCDERCLFCGCHVIITPDHERARPYLDLLKKEMALVAERLPDRRRFAQLHLGGGTPTYYSPRELDSLVSALLTDYSPLEGAELAVELDPRVTTKEHVDALAELGFNRMSLGVQDFTASVQERVHRVQTPEETRAVIEHGRRRGYRGINVDLIYGLPLQTTSSFEKTVEQVIDMGVDRVACYSFAYVPWLRGHQKKLDESELPSTDVKSELFALARERFLAAGYEPIGMDHFAKPDDDLARAKREARLKRNFQGYAVIPGDDVIGFGISAIGDVRGALMQNEKKLSRYTETIEANRLPVDRGIVRSRDDAIRGDVIHRLMCNFVIEREDVEAVWNIDFGEYFSEALERLESYRDEGLVSIDATSIRATPIGELFVRNLAMCFDRYMWEKHAGSDKPTFSRTV